MLKKIIHYITYDIWFKKEHEYKSPQIRWLVRQLKVVLFTAQGIGENNLIQRSAALTFYTLMSLVPIAALVFGIAKGFGLEVRLNNYLYAEFPQYTLVIDQVIEFANALLQRTKGGILASAGLLVLFWSVIKVFSNVEKAFNSIWEVRKARSITRKFSDYFTVVVVTPILWIISNSIRLQLQDKLTNFFTSSWIVQFLFGLLAFVMIWLMFTFLYKIMPNTKVKFKSALMAGIIAGTFFQLFQIIYVSIQSNLTNYNAIYGSFAAFPLFLIWMQASWQILLLGAELSFAYQNINQFEYEKQSSEMSYDYRKKAMLVVMQQIVNHYIHNDGAVSSEEIARDARLPVRIVRDVIFDMEKAGLIVSVASESEKTNRYVPAKDVHDLRVFDVVNKVETNGADPLDIEQSPEYYSIDKIFDQIEDLIRVSSYNMRLMDIDNLDKKTSTTERNGKNDTLSDSERPDLDIEV